MKKKSIFLIFILILVLLCGCSKDQTTYSEEEYFLDLDYSSDFRILQLTDIHLANKDNRQKQYDFLDLTIKDSNADLIVICGDIFTFADKTVAKELFGFLDSYGIPWTLTFGNHDEQCYFSIDWVTNLLNNYGSNCIFKDLQDDDVYGNANFVISLNKDGSTKYQVMLLDSNRYNYGEYWGYDYLKDSQISWYEKMVNYTTNKNGRVVPSLCFFHIPVPEFQMAMDEVILGSPDAILEYGEMGEPSSCPKENTGFFDKVLELGSTKGIIVGHDHIDNSRILYKGVYLSYGITSTDRIYYNEEMMGGQVIVIHDDETLSFEQIYHEYSEVDHE